jgi:hypothetical protein
MENCRKSDKSRSSVEEKRRATRNKLKKRKGTYSPLPPPPLPLPLPVALPTPDGRSSLSLRRSVCVNDPDVKLQRQIEHAKRLIRTKSKYASIMSTGTGSESPPSATAASGSRVGRVEMKGTFECIRNESVGWIDL